MRLYTAIVTGLLAFILYVLIAWNLTSMDALEIAVWGVFTYYIGLAAGIWITEPRQKKKQARKHTEPTFYDMKEDTHV